MKNTYKFLILFMLLPFAISASVKDGKYTKNKVIKKEFTVLKDATLNVTNKYGNIDIITWNENTIRIEVSITTNGDDEEKVKDKLDETRYFRLYAFTNQYEFMAVLAEYFIESPADFKAHFPQLYDHTKKLLNFRFAGN